MAATQGIRNASPRTQGKRPGDLTGVRGQQLAAQADKDKAEAASQVEQTRAEEVARKRSEVVDYTGSQTTPVAQQVEETEVEVRPAVRRIRVNYGIEQMTFGKEVVHEGTFDENGVMIQPPVLGNLRRYDFEEGRYYDVPADVADHLEFLGYIY
jgi:sRNA-binding protein